MDRVGNGVRTRNSHTVGTETVSHGRWPSCPGPACKRFIRLVRFRGRLSPHICGVEKRNSQLNWANVTVAE